MNKVDLLFVFPPAGNHEHPHLGLPLLLGYLREHNIKNCLIKDYNAPFYGTAVKRVNGTEARIVWRKNSGLRKKL